MPAMIRKFHLAKLAAAGDNPALAADTKTHGLRMEIKNYPGRWYQTNLQKLQSRLLLKNKYKYTVGGFAIYAERVINEA